MAKKLSAFERQFVANRRAGKKEFMFGGKSYSTKQKGEGGSTKVAAARVKLPKRGPVPTSRPADTAKVPTPTPRDTVVSKVTGRPLPTGPRKPAPTPARPNKPSVPTPAGQGTGDIYRIVDRNRTNPPPATADNAAAVAKFNTAKERGQRVAAGTPFPAAPARKAAGTPFPGAPTPTPKPTHTTAKTDRPVPMPRADFKSKQSPVPMPTVKPTHTTSKTNRPVKMPDAARFGGAITTAKTDRPKRKTTAVASR